MTVVISEATMILPVNFKSGVPVYLQIVQQVKAAAASGRLRAGDALPSVRALSEELRINRNTAAKAYAELESAGVIETRPGLGCYLKQNGASPLTRGARHERLRTEVDALLVEAHHLGVGEEDLKRLLTERLEVLRERVAEGVGELGKKS